MTKNFVHKQLTFINGKDKS